MSRPRAVELWGEAMVARALAEPEPERITVEVARLIEEHAREPEEDFRAWTLALPWPRLALIIRVVSGTTAAELLEGEDA